MIRRIGTAALFLVLSALRFAHWGAPFTADEAFTIKKYAAFPVASIVSTYDAPNNHLLLSLLLHGIDALSAHKLFATLASPWPLQLPSILASIAALALLYSTAALLLNRRVAVLAMAALGVSFWPLAYSHMLRGYSLSIFLNLLCVRLALQALIKKRPAWLLPLPAALAAAHYLIPTNAAFTAGLAIGTVLLMRARGERWTPRAAAAPVSALAAAAVLTYWAYRPVLGQMLAYARSAAHPEGAAAAVGVLDAFRVLGAGRAYQVLFAAVASYGLVFALRRRGKWRAAAVFTAAYLAVPPLLFAALGAPPPARVFTGDLPFWALAFAAGLYGAGAALRSRLRPGRLSPGRLCAALVLIVLAVSAGQVREFWNWNRGLDARRAFRQIASEVEHSDDFAVIAAELGDRGEIGDNIDWEYYGYSSAIFPYYNMGLMRDFPYLIRGKYFILAQDEASARAAMSRTNVDPFLAESLRQTGARGRLKCYELAMDDAVLARERAALGDSAAAPALRAAALTGLGFDALRRERPAEAARFLGKAKALAPSDEKVRYLLGWADYLSFDDEKAGAELGWVVAHDSANVHAPLYYADTLAERGRFDEALRWYAYYDGPNVGPGGWMFADRAKIGAEAARRRFTARLDRADPDALTRSALRYGAMGSYERAVAAFTEAFRLRPSLANRDELIMADFELKKYAAAEIHLRSALADGGGDSFRLALARELAAKQDFAAARALAAEALKAAPASEEATRLSRDLERL